MKFRDNLNCGLNPSPSKKVVKRKFKNYTGLIYILPWIIGFVVFQLYPFIATLFYSFTNYSLGRVPKFIGLKNYIDMFTNDPYFFQAVKVTTIYVMMVVPLKLIFALFIAIILNVKIKFVNFFRTIYYIPSILAGSVTISILWRALFVNDGLVNNLLSFFHIGQIQWLGSSLMALFTISMLGVWQFGSSMVLFLAGLKQIPKELYEAGKVDGASKIRMFRIITIPLLTPIIFFNLIMQMINAFQEFTSAFVVTNGGPMRGTYLFGMKLYEEAFKNFKMGYASSLSWMLFLAIMVFTLLIFKSSSSWVHYEDGGEF